MVHILPVSIDPRCLLFVLSSRGQIEVDYSSPNYSIIGFVQNLPTEFLLSGALIEFETLDRSALGQQASSIQSIVRFDFNGANNTTYEVVRPISAPIPFPASGLVLMSGLGVGLIIRGAKRRS
ncbi:hypothetical protein [Roseobacter sinensis]|uniref:VPLPA-CTERM sorting domain-containing protein n=1 Tax=Roseobacter sinensis TaxID=2931391 RepID=A0ABT3BM38_9RHOB|nr:hypothetical protein [Roseobacter sp. WL0113]MCV3274433.1 hypothetical protein [Roseobacter sp. WL0113]